MGSALNTGANILVAGALALVAYSIGGRLGLFGRNATQHALAWYLPDVILGGVTIFYLGDFRDHTSRSFAIGFAAALTARLIWRGMLMWRVHYLHGLGAKAVNMFCVFAVATLSVKAWLCVVSSSVNQVGLQSINQILGLFSLGWFIPAIFWLVGKPRNERP